MSTGRTNRSGPDPRDGATRLYLGNVLFVAGRDEAAIEHFREGWRLIPDSPTLPVALAMALMRVDKGREAVAVLQDAVRRHPENRDLQVAYQSLKQSADLVFTNAR